VSVRSANPHLLDQVSPATSGFSSRVIVKVLVSAVQKGAAVYPVIVFQVLEAHSATILTVNEVVLVG
jgi:hypothetical protein